MFKRVTAVLLGALIAFVVFEWITFPDVSRLATENPVTTAFMEQRKRELREAGKDDTLSYHPVDYEQISPYLRRAVLVAEDDTFYEHGGVDVKALQEAIQRDWERKRLTHGGSTITQQLAKNLYLSPARTPLRKVKEYFIANALERHLTKKRILELYLNVVEMGERVYGAEAAARRYFSVSAAALTPQQAALLAGCLPNPQMMNPDLPNKRLLWRQRMILSRMRRWGYLFERQVLTEKAPAAAPAVPETETSLLEQTKPTDTATPAEPPPPTETTTEPPPPLETAPPPTDTSPPTEPSPPP